MWAVNLLPSCMLIAQCVIELVTAGDGGEAVNGDLVMNGHVGVVRGGRRVGMRWGWREGKVGWVRVYADKQKGFEVV